MEILIDLLYNRDENAIENLQQPIEGPFRCLANKVENSKLKCDEAHHQKDEGEVRTGRHARLGREEISVIQKFLINSIWRFQLG